MTGRTITYLYRKPSPRFHSIEKVFDLVKKGLGNRRAHRDHYLSRDNGGFRNKILNILEVRRIRAEVLHVTGDVYYTTLLFRGRLILTIHDIGEIYKGNFLRRWLIKMLWFQLPARKAEYITFISESSKNEFVRQIKVDENKLLVIHNPLGTDYQFMEPNAHQKPHLLQIGTKSNKNLEHLIEAIANIPCHLHIIGRLSTVQQQLLKSKNIDYSNDHGISEEQVIKHYRNSDIVCYVSTYEGFGLPIIEAQASGRPVVSSPIPPSKEVSGDAVLYADPQNPSDIGDKIRRLINDRELYNDLVQRGVKNAERFRLQPIADQFLELYQRLDG